MTVPMPMLSCLLKFPRPDIAYLSQKLATMLNKKTISILILLAIVAVFIWLFFFRTKEVSIEKGQEEISGMNFPESSLSGIRCENGKSRPLAVMLASDIEARPLSGLSEADMVFEMPVTDGGVTRTMAVFQCKWPEEIGSVRSSRIDFIPLAQGLGAMYTHWGGEREALKQLNGKIIDNIDAMKYDGTIFYRKSEVRPPHNGFTSAELLNKVIANLSYSLSKESASYLHEEGKSLGTLEPPLIYKEDFEVGWKYDPEKNVYLRFRRGTAETDRSSSKQIEASNIVFLKTTWLPISKDYIRVKTVGSGEAVFYKNGQEVKGSWEKKSSVSKLYFYDSQKQEIKFVPGQIWVEIII